MNTSTAELANNRTKSDVEPNEELAENGAKSGVELDQDTLIKNPFDPNSISIEPKVISMDLILRRLKQGSIRLAPAFQRKFVWDKTRSSQLIESLMLRIPLPMFYASANPDGSWDVVDGLQRLTTIRNFILGDETDPDGKKIFPEVTTFKLQNLEFWGDTFDGKTFKEIENDPAHAKVINNILESEFRFTIINPGTPEEVKRNIFKRINTGGMPLTSQEIRHALYQGKSSLLLEDLVNKSYFNDAIDNSIDDSRMAGRELILRFLSFTIRSEKLYDGDMDSWLSDTMRILNLLPDTSNQTELNKIFPKSTPEILTYSEQILVSRFESAMQRCHKLFKDYAFRKSITGRRTPVNKSLFDTWSNIIADLSDSEFKTLLANKECFFKDYEDLLRGRWFDIAVSKDASSSTSVTDRYKKFRKLIGNTLKGSL